MKRLGEVKNRFLQLSTSIEVKSLRLMELALHGQQCGGESPEKAYLRQECRQ